MFRHLLRAITLIAFCVCLVVPATAQIKEPGSGASSMPKTLRGRVRLPSGAQAAQGFLVTIRDGSMVEFGRVMTDSRGEFQFENLNAGVYWVQVTARGYLPAEQRADLEFGAGGIIELNLKRDPKVPDVPAEGPAATIAANAPQTEVARKELSAGQDLLFTKKDPKSSVAHFEQVTKAEPKYAPGYMLLATAALLSQDFQKAVSASNTAIQLNKDSAPAYLLHGMASEGINDLDAAQKSFAKTIELNPDSYEAHLELGKILLSKSDARGAEKHLKKAMQLNAKAALPHALLGNALLSQKDGNGALAEFKAAVQLEPQGPMAPALNQKIASMEQAMKAKK